MKLLSNLKENLISVLPVMLIVLILHFTVAPLDVEVFQRFLIGSVLLIIGLSLFLTGAEMSVLPMGEMMGSTLSKDHRLWLIILVGFVIGFGITVAEPDVQVLASQVSDVSGGEIPRMLLIVTVACGVGFMIAVSLLRVVFQIPLSKVLLISYIVVFAVAIFTKPDFLAVAFDSGGVTTGPMTVPLILSLGVGVASIRGSKSGEDDSFGLVALASVGPILAVLLLGVFY